MWGGWCWAVTVKVPGRRNNGLKKGDYDALTEDFSGAGFGLFFSQVIGRWNAVNVLNFVYCKPAPAFCAGGMLHNYTIALLA